MFNSFAERPTASSLKLIFCTAASSMYIFNEYAQTIRINTGINIYNENNIPYANAIIDHASSGLAPLTGAIIGSTYIKFTNRPDIKNLRRTDKELLDAIAPAIFTFFASSAEVAGALIHNFKDACLKLPYTRDLLTNENICNTNFDEKDMVAIVTAGVIAYGFNKV